MRINKYLSSRGVCSRREADRLILEGHVKINGKKAELGSNVGDEDVVEVKGKPIDSGREDVYIAYHKPRGVEVTMAKGVDNNLQKALRMKEHMFPIGRLDKAASGLLLVTNDGDIVNKILKPAGGHEKEYIVNVMRPVTKSFIEKMSSGVKIEKRKTRPAIVTRQNRNAFRIILTEGRNRQIRKMVETCGNMTTGIKRVRVMNIKLGRLRPGESRPLSKKEVRELKASLK